MEQKGSKITTKPSGRERERGSQKGDVSDNAIEEHGSLLAEGSQKYNCYMMRIYLLEY